MPQRGVSAGISGYSSIHPLIFFRYEPQSIVVFLFTDHYILLYSSHIHPYIGFARPDHHKRRASKPRGWPSFLKTRCYALSRANSRLEKHQI